MKKLSKVWVVQAMESNPKPDSVPFQSPSPLLSTVKVVLVTKSVLYIIPISKFILTIGTLVGVLSSEAKD